MYKLLKVGESTNPGDEICWPEYDGKIMEWRALDWQAIKTVIECHFPIRRDMTMWKDGVPPVGTSVRVGNEDFDCKERWIVVGNTKGIQVAETRDGYNIDIKDIKPWEE